MNQIKITHHYPGGQRLEIVEGDITQEPVEAIVNAANDRLQHGGGLAAIIARKGGPQIDRESREWVQRQGPVSHASPAYTRAGDLSFRYIIHAVGPVWGSGEEDKKLQQAVSGCLQRAEELDLRSLALPAISTGIFRFPVQRAAWITLDALEDHFSANPQSNLQQVRLTLFDQKTTAAFTDVYDRQFQGARADDFSLHPLPELRAVLPFERHFTAGDYRRLRRGYRPLEMEDKWVILFQEEWLAFHRSWTGYCIYRLELAAANSAFRVEQAWVNRDPRQHQGTQEQGDVQTLNYLMDRLLLGPG